MNIAGRPVGRGEPCFVVAEAGVNHNGDPALALELARAAAGAGADAVKFQTFSAERLAAPAAQKAAYQVAAGPEGECQLDMLRRLELPRSAYPPVLAECRRLGILFLSTPFDEESADFLESLDVPAFKIGSGELTNLPLLEHVARKRRPMLVSTGMSDLDEVRSAVEAVARAGGAPLALLHAVSNYPADPRDANLRAMLTLEAAFQVPVGYSDHVDGPQVALAAVALGASILEKHLTLDRSLPGPDQRASMDPAGFSALVRAIRTVEAALGDGVKRPAAAERATAAAARRSLVAAAPIARGTVMSERLIALRRPGTGMAPGLRQRLVGRKARQDIAEGTLLREDLFE